MFERAGDRAHLGVQKRARADADLNFLAGPPDIEPFQRAHRAVRLALGSAKSREVVASNEMPRRRLHGPGIELSLDEPGMASPHRQGRAAIDDPVEIMAPHRRDPRVENLRARVRRPKWRPGAAACARSGHRAKHRSANPCRDRHARPGPWHGRRYPCVRRRVLQLFRRKER